MPSEKKLLPDMSPTVPTNVGKVFVEPGQTLTVYLRHQDGGVLQVELRVKPSGGPEVFVRDSMLDTVRSFDHWEPMREGD